MKKLVLSLIPLIGLSVPVAASAETSYPTISGELSVELENDWTHESDDEEGEITDLYPTVTLGTKVGFTNELSVNLEATLEPVEDANDDRAFEDLGAYVNILTVNYDANLFSVYAGKFTPNFGIAWDAAPGLFGTDINEDYELAEMLGAGGALNFAAAGAHTVSGSLFFQDTTFLSDSLGDSRGPVDESDGGPANTEDLSSFALALDGEFSALEGFRYHVGFSSLEEGDDGDKNQNGYVVGAEYSFNLTEEITATPLVEYAFIDNAGGIDDDETQYITAAFALNYGGWDAAATYQHRDTETAGDDFNDYVAALTVGYTFENGIGISGGLREADEEGVESSTAGVLLSYAIEF
ncbi:MAG: hypothetical protein V7750_17670 [Sneathiella sp.]